METVASRLYAFGKLYLELSLAKHLDIGQHRAHALKAGLHLIVEATIITHRNVIDGETNESGFHLLTNQTFLVLLGRVPQHVECAGILDLTILFIAALILAYDNPFFHFSYLSFLFSFFMFKGDTLNGLF